MKKARLDTLLETLQSDGGLRQRIGKVALFYRFKGIWYNSNEKTVENKLLSAGLDQFSKSEYYSRPQNSEKIFIPIKDMDVVIQISLPRRPQKNTCEIIFDLAKKCIVNSQNEYNAKYDILTSLLNRETFVSRITDGISQVNNQGNLSLEVKEKDATKGITLYALDIDNFKQVNDTYGHKYGDMVIKCFSIRLENICHKINKENENIFLLPSRFSGEEFYVLCSGQITTNIEDLIAESLRRGISDSPLPTNEEWDQLILDGVPEGFDIPHETLRRITTSIGVSSYKGEKTNSELRQIKDDLLRNSDLALYKAKSNGRNRHVHFSDILHKHGKILEFNKAAGVVAIDIGRPAGVTVGQEFLVFYPHFTGNQPFIFRDGRTEKVLGLYPRISSARIEVINVQSDVSFCKITKKGEDTEIPVGSYLESVPLGSISHLLHDDTFLDRRHSRLLDFPILRTKLDGISEKEKSDVMAVSFAIQNIQEVQTDHGIAFINRVLASLFHAIDRTFPLPSLIGQVSGGEFILISLSGKIDTKKVRDVIGDVEKEYKDTVVIISGIYGILFASLTGVGDESVLSGENCIEYARYAVLLSGSEEKVTYFTPQGSSRVIYNARVKKGNQDGVINDYRSLKEIGVRNAYFENQFGLACYSNKDYKKAIEAFSEAVRLHPEEYVFKANLGLALYLADEPIRAAEEFKKILSKNPDHTWGDVYLSAVSLALFEAWKAGDQAIERGYLNKILEQSKDHHYKSYGYGREYWKLLGAVSSLTADTKN